MRGPAASAHHCGKYKQMSCLPAYAARRPLLPKLAASDEHLANMDNLTHQRGNAEHTPDSGSCSYRYSGMSSVKQGFSQLGM